MLKVIDFAKIEHFTLEIGDYIPFSFRNLDSDCRTPIYWRTGDFHKKLIEVGLETYLGAICKVTVTLIGNFLPLSDSHQLVYDEIISGIPICDVSEWTPLREMRDWHTEAFKDETIYFDTFIDSSNVSIRFTQAKVLAKAFQVGNVLFGIDTENLLCSLEFKNISTSDMEKILWQYGV